MSILLQYNNITTGLCNISYLEYLILNNNNIVIIFFFNKLYIKYKYNIKLYIFILCDFLFYLI